MTSPQGPSELCEGDPTKVLDAVLLRERTSVGNRWLAEPLAMGHTGGLSRVIGKFSEVEENVKRLSEINKMLQQDT